MPTVEELKRRGGFDKEIADILAQRISQKVDINPELLVEKIKQKINPRIHQILPDESSKNTQADGSK